jgi:5'-nucleotidase/UDP-sugar diphosphatase
VEAVPGIDVFVGGHAHRGIEVPWVGPKNGSIVVQTYGRGTTVGVLQLTYDQQARKVLAHTGSLLRVMPGVFPTPAAVEQVVSHWVGESNRLGGEVVGTAAAPLNREYNGESALGDVIADAMRWKTGAQLALENAGGIRGDIPAGPITRNQVISAAPFINSLVTMNLTGAQLRELLEQSLTLKVGMMQVSGLRMTYDLSRPEYHRLISVHVRDTPLEDARSYSVVTNSFLATGGDHYETFLKARPQQDRGMLVADVLEEYVRTKHTLEAPQGGRIVAVTPR